MSRHIRSTVVIALAAGLMWSCGGERVMQSEVGTDGPGGRPLSKLAVGHHKKAQALAMVTLHRDGTPVSGATVEFSRSIAGQAPDYQWSGTTDDKGQTLVEITSGNGYYQARASQNGDEIGSWSSIPINAGYKVVLYLPIGGKAQVKSSSSMDPVKQITARDVKDKKTLQAYIEAAAEYAQNFPFSDAVKEAFRQEGGRWKHADIYLSLIDTDGVMLFHGANPSLDGRDLIDLEDVNGVKIVQELIAAAAAGGGFVDYYFDNPAIDENGDGDLLGDPIGSPKISYAIPVVDPITGMEFLLTAGFYPVTARAVVDKETLKAFVEAAKEYVKSFPFSEQIKEEFRQEGGRWRHADIYLSLGNADGVLLFHGANPSLDGRDLIDLEDVNGVKIIQELIAVAAAGGGFVEYYFDNPAIDENGDGDLLGDPIGSPKITYAIPVTDPQTGMEFILTAGFYPQMKK